MTYIRIRSLAKAFSIALIFIVLTGCGSMNIWQASEFGQDSEIKTLLEKNPRLINAKDDRGRTPLLHAVIGQKERTVKLLLERGADPRIKADSNWDALHEAKQHDSKAIVKIVEAAVNEANDLDSKNKENNK